MRIRRLAVAVLLSTTFLCGPAHAGPVVGFLSGFWAGLTTGVVAGAGIGGAWAAGAAVGSFLTGGTILARVVLSIGLSALSTALMPKPPAIPPAEIMANYAQDVLFAEYVYGRVRKGGPFALSAYSRAPSTVGGGDDHARRHYGIIMAAHSTRGPVTHYLDKWQVEVAGPGPVTALTGVYRIFTTNRPSLSGEFPVGDDDTSHVRVLLTAQTNPVQNGIWVTGVLGWTRPTDFNGSSSYQVVETQRLGTYYHCDMSGKTVGVHPQDWRAGRAPAAGEVITDPVAGYCRIRSYTGHAGQAADPVWRAVFPEVSAADNFAGLSYSALWARRPSDGDFARIYPNGREWVYAPVWDGCDTIYDPRTGLSGWSNNAALVIADVATRIYGKTVDWAEVAAEADIADQAVVNGDGGTQKRWTINTVIRSNMTWEEARGHLQMCCDAFFYERRDGKLGFKVGAYAAPTLTLTGSDMLALSARHKAKGVDEVGSFAIRYVEPARDYSEEVSGAVVVDPLGQRAEQECFGIDSHNQAWRVIYRWARTARAEWQISATLKFVGREVMEHRFVRIQHDELAIDEVFEVSTLARNQGTHTWQLEAVSVAAADFAPSALALEPPRTMRATIAEDGTVPVVPSLTGSVVVGTGGAAMVEFSWPAQANDLRQQLRHRCPEIGLTEWQVIEMANGQLSSLLTGLVDGTVIEAQIRNRDTTGRLGTWSPEVPLEVTAVANSTPPAAMQDFTGMVAGSSVGLAFTPPNDPVYAAARIYRATGSTDFGAAVLVRVEFGAPNLADEWTDPAPGSGTHSYWIVPINGSGIPGPTTGPLTFTII